jgi:dihydroflavonol-4-reductase
LSLDLVTGASGHVGGNLVRALLASGRRVRALVHDDDALALKGLDVERVRGDVRDPASLPAAMKGVDIVYHLAALISIAGDRGGAVSATNVEGVKNVAQAALAGGVRRFVHCSSIHAFRLEAKERPIHEGSPRSDWPGAGAYDRSKARGEIELQRVVAMGLDAVVVNPTGILGPLDFRPSRMGRVLLALHERSLPALIGGGFDWVDVRDVVSGVLAAGEKGRRGENYILAGNWHSVSEVGRMAESVTGVPAPRFVVPMHLARVAAPFATLFGHVTRQEPLFTSEGLAALRADRGIDRSKAARELGFTTRPTLETIRSAYDWFGSAGLLTARSAATATTS